LENSKSTATLTKHFHEVIDYDLWYAFSSAEWDGRDLQIGSFFTPDADLVV